MKNFVDLHVHTNKSDGSYSLSEIIEQAIQLHLVAIAITDHDTTDALLNIPMLKNYTDLQIIHGVELTAYHKIEKEIHILGYGIDIKSKKLQDELKIIQSFRFRESLQLIKMLLKNGIPISLDDIVSNGYQVNSYGIKKLLIEKGYLDNDNQTKNMLFIQDKILNINKYRLTTEKAIQLIKAAGGKAYLAHPTTISDKLDIIKLLIENLINEGISGIECYNSIYNQNPNIEMCNLAKEYKLEVCGGTDFHGKVKPSVSLGRGKGDIYIGYDILQKMGFYNEHQTREY